MPRLTHLLFAAVATVTFTAVCSFASLVDASGNISGWGITPFSQSNGQYANTTTGTFSTIANNYAPINYPSVGYLPSPGGSNGEKFDLEEMHLRVTGGQLQVLVVTSSPMVASVNGTWYLGDLMLNVNGSKYAVITQDVTAGGAARGYTPGAVIAVTDDSQLLKLQNSSNSYLTHNELVENDYGADATVRDVAGPWQVVTGLSPVASGAIETDMHSYTGEANTFFIQYTVNLADLTGDSEADIAAHIAWGCGNDVIEVEALGVHEVPEPASMVLMAVGGMMLLSRKRRG